MVRNVHSPREEETMKHLILIGLGGNGFRAICDCGWQSNTNWTRAMVAQAGNVHKRSSQCEETPTERGASMPCRRTNLDPDTVVFTCGRSNPPVQDLPTCSSCGAPNAKLVCQFDLTGNKTGQRCEKPLCRKCVRRAVTDRYLCPPHHKLTTQSLVNKDNSSP